MRRDDDQNDRDYRTPKQHQSLFRGLKDISIYKKTKSKLSQISLNPFDFFRTKNDQAKQETESQPQQQQQQQNPIPQTELNEEQQISKVSQMISFTPEYVKKKFNLANSKKEIKKYGLEVWAANLQYKKAQEEILKSIITCVKKLKFRPEHSKDRFKIFVKDNQLHITGRTVEAKEPFTNLANTLQVAQLYKIIYSKFNHGENTKQQATQKIEKIFKKLYEILQFLLIKSYSQEEDRCALEEIDFLIFPKKYIQAQYKKKGMNYERKGDHQPILIGGLLRTCFRFFRSKRTTFSDIQKRNKPTFCKQQYKKIFEQKCLQQIGKKMREIISYEEKRQPYHDPQIQKQMKGFQFESVLQDFLEMDPWNIQQNYSSVKSIKQFKWEKALNQMGEGSMNIQMSIELPLEEKSNKNLQIRRYSKSGNLLSNTNRRSINLLELLQLKEFVETFQITEDQIVVLKSQISEYKFLQHTLKNRRDGISIDSTGKFLIMSEDENLCNKYYEMIKEKYKIEQSICQNIFTLKKNIGFSIILQQLNKIEEINKFLNYGTFQKKSQIEKTNKKKFKFNTLHKKFSQDPNRLHPEPTQEFVRTSYEEPSTNFSQDANKPYILYRFSYRYDDSYYNSKRDATMRFYITAEGDIKIENIINKESIQKAQLEVERLKKLIDYQQNKVSIERKRKQVREEQQKSQNLLMKISSFPKDNDGSVENHDLREDYDHKYEFNWRKTMGYNKTNGSLEPFYKNGQATRTRLKILTWNIWGFRYEEDYLSTQLIGDYKELEEQRIQKIIDSILHYNPDIICLQEGYVFFADKLQDRPNPNLKLFKQKLITKLQKDTRIHKYYYAQYNPNMNDHFDYSRQRDREKRNERTIILSKFPTKFYTMVFKYKNQMSQQQRRRFKAGAKALVLSELFLSLNINSQGPDVQNPEQLNLKVLIASIHLKSGKGDFDDQVRQYQFDALNSFRQQYKFDMCIFAGDFNSYDEPITELNRQKQQQKPLSSIGQLIKENGFIDPEDLSSNKTYTIVKGNNTPKVVDKILFHIRNPQLKKRLEILDIQLVGTEPLPEYQNQNPNTVVNNGQVKTPSDHIGRYVQFAFKP